MLLVWFSCPKTRQKSRKEHAEMLWNACIPTLLLSCMRAHAWDHIRDILKEKAVQRWDVFGLYTLESQMLVAQCVPHLAENTQVPISSSTSLNLKVCFESQCPRGNIWKAFGGQVKLGLNNFVQHMAENAQVASSSSTTPKPNLKHILKASVP